VECIVAEGLKSPAERLVPLTLMVIETVENQSMNADDERGLSGLAKRAQEHQLADSLALGPLVHSQSTQKDDADGTLRQALRGDYAAIDRPCDQRVVAENVRRTA
jgi:hypothetical protein